MTLLYCSVLQLSLYTAYLTYIIVFMYTALFWRKHIWLIKIMKWQSVHMFNECSLANMIQIIITLSLLFNVRSVLIAEAVSYFVWELREFNIKQIRVRNNLKSYITDLSLKMWRYKECRQSRLKWCIPSDKRCRILESVAH